MHISRILDNTFRQYIFLTTLCHYQYPDFSILSHKRASKMLWRKVCVNCSLWVLSTLFIDHSYEISLERLLWAFFVRNGQNASGEKSTIIKSQIKNFPLKASVFWGVGSPALKPDRRQAQHLNCISVWNSRVIYGNLRPCRETISIVKKPVLFFTYRITRLRKVTSGDYRMRFHETSKLPTPLTWDRQWLRREGCF